MLEISMEFHVSRQARDRYQFDEALFMLSGNVILSNLHGARVFAQKMNERRDLVSFPEQAVKAGHLNAMGLIDELSHQIMQQYRDTANPPALERALQWLDERLGKEAVSRTLRRFADEFPPLAVYRREAGLEEYVEGETDGVPHRQILLEEMLMLWLANLNPAFAPFLELFDDDSLSRQTAYAPIMEGLHDYFDTQPHFGPDNENVIDMLRAPARAHPYSLFDQLEFIRRRWGGMLGRYLYRLLGGQDLIREETHAVFAGPGPSLVYEFAEGESEPEHFSRDLDWMPQLVLMAKNTYVWLHQLSQQYKRPITRLDQVPNEELDKLARWGFTGLWLIGVWERSSASQRIKQLTGNPEAVASAYSLYDYVVAPDLGGQEAYQNLKARAWQRGIRMASDMVPNHVGIYSRWVIEHPDWFVSLGYSPFPSYSFGGPDLSEDGRVGIFLEDHYYERSDAAVVFRRLDRWTDSNLFIYHGNDGTSMPWNDTAQLNYLNPEVREAVIQTILHVARQFPVIRFDAAMTLTKRHYQRLWFPEPGTGGAIPTRAENGLTKEQFDAAMPAEFWREVVDRVAAEAPDTLLLAEAFWLLEGYFVRTLGMHRVYNSAFMNMLRSEENANYRSTMKNTLEFDPEILKRFVSFMNNPDEETAVAQFGKGDKYFGIATMLATLPGLPMFGHGQIEGYAEKYGMEYRRAYWDEQPDPALVERHERQIFPLLQRRHLFAQVEHFLLYDLFTPEGHVNEDVFAYSNRSGDVQAGMGERALVVYHNKFATARGWVRTSVGFLARNGDGNGRAMVQRTLGEGLGLRNEPGIYYVFRDHVAGLEYIRGGQDLCQHGLYVELDAYKCQVLLDWREVQEDEWHRYSYLADYLNGRGVPSIEEAQRELFLRPILQPFRELANAGQVRWLMAQQVTRAGQVPDAEVMAEVERRAFDLWRGIGELTGGSGDAQALARETRAAVEAALQLPVLARRFPLAGEARYQAAVKMIQDHLDADPVAWATLLGWILVHPLGKMLHPEGDPELSRSWMDEWRLSNQLAGVVQDLGLEEGAARWRVGTIRALVKHQDWCLTPAVGEQRAYQVLLSWLKDGEVQRFLQVNRHVGVLWFNKESFDQLLAWMMTIAAVQISAGTGTGAGSEDGVARAIVDCYDVVNRLQAAEEASEYQVVKLMEAAKGPAAGLDSDGQQAGGTPGRPASSPERPGGA
jgi:glycosidase